MAPAPMLFISSLVLCVPAAAQGVVYSAGSAGSPPLAPDPQTQGWTLTDPSSGQVGLTPLSPDGTTGLNAWQIDDQATFNGGRAHYGALFTPGELDLLSMQGWALTLDMRIESASGVDVFAEFATGTAASDDRYLSFFTVSGNDVVADLFLSGIQYVCTGGNDGGYHQYVIRKPAGTLDAQFWYDGVLLGPAPRENANGNAPNGGVHWGSGSSPSTATANWNFVELVPLGFPPIGANYCSPSLPNSSGASAEIAATGSSMAGGFPLTLMASNLPVNQFGYFLAGRTQGLFNPPGSQGLICLAGNIGRYNAPSQIGFSGPSGSFELDVDTTAIPVNPPMPAMAGETWNFQCWFRDLNPTLTSNFTDGLSILFQ
ncbi:MAG: hypothetical protein GY711_19035 [bacterium]|nr:hypothetical protein [bacterium]